MLACIPCVAAGIHSAQHRQHGLRLGCPRLQPAFDRGQGRGTVFQKYSHPRLIYSPGTSGLPASLNRRRMIFQPGTLSAFRAGSKHTPARINSSAILPAPCPDFEKQVPSAPPRGSTFHRWHIAIISSASKALRNVIGWCRGSGDACPQVYHHARMVEADQQRMLGITRPTTRDIS